MKFKTLGLMAVLTVGLAGCFGHPYYGPGPVLSGAAVGAAAGAVGGAIVGAPGVGAAVGAASGAVLGAASRPYRYGYGPRYSYYGYYYAPPRRRYWGRPCCYRY